jgi:murein DD-endopeptidase MepM/ murein hydrolase activator NlpD
VGRLLKALLLSVATIGPTPGNITLPVAGIAAKDLVDTFDQKRGANRHEAIDIMEPRGTPVRAVVDGTIAKLFLSKPGGNTIYLFDSARLFCYYYAHLDHYAPGLREGQRVKAGDVIAFVGSTGNASALAPHLHFAIFKLGPERRWWEGNTPINPYPTLLEAVRTNGSNGKR